MATDNDRPMRSRARLLAIALEGGAARDDKDAVNRAYSKIITLRSLGGEVISREDLVNALGGSGADPQLADRIMQHLTKRF